MLALPSLTSQATFEVWGVPDGEADGNEAITFTLSAIPNAPYTLGNITGMEVLILDDSLEPPAAGECTPTAPIGVPTPTVGQGAGVPASLDVFPIGNDALDVRWAASSDRATKWNAYEVQYRLSGTAWPTDKGIGNAERGTQYFGRATHGGHYFMSIDGLTAGARYDVRVSNAKEEEYDRTVCAYEGEFTYKATRVVEVSGQSRTKSSVLIPSGSQASQGGDGRAAAARGSGPTRVGKPPATAAVKPAVPPPRPRTCR